MPFEARWGLATLPAGDYSFKLDRAGPGGMLHLYNGTRTVALVAAQTWAPQTAGRSALLVVQAHGANVVREMNLPDIGMTLYYAPHNPRHGSAAEERQVTRTIPLTWRGAGQ